MPQKVTYTVVEVAELLGISRTSAYECVRRGEIPSLTLGRASWCPVERSTRCSTWTRRQLIQPSTRQSPGARAEVCRFR